MKKNRLSLTFLGLLIAASPLRAQDTPQTETAEQKDKRMEWFSQAKLGIFIHWGIYSVRGVSESWSFFNTTCPTMNTWSRKKVSQPPSMIRKTGWI